MHVLNPGLVAKPKVSARKIVPLINLVNDNKNKQEFLRRAATAMIKEMKKGSRKKSRAETIPLLAKVDAIESPTKKFIIKNSSPRKQRSPSKHSRTELVADYLSITLNSRETSRGPKQDIAIAENLEIDNGKSEIVQGETFDLLNIFTSQNQLGTLSRSATSISTGKDSTLIKKAESLFEKYSKKNEVEYKSLGWSPLVEKVTAIDRSPTLEARTVPVWMIYPNISAESPRRMSQKSTTPAFKSVASDSPKSPKEKYLNPLQNSPHKTIISGPRIFPAKTIQDSNKFSAFIPDLGRLTEENIPVNFEGVSVMFSDDSEEQSMPGSPSQVSHSLVKSNDFELKLSPLLEVDSRKFSEVARMETQDGNPTPTPPMVSIKNNRKFF